MAAPLRVGSVPYLVGRPLDQGLDEEPGIELRRAVPAKLVQGLREGSLDVALVSSIELFRQPGCRYLDQLAVAGRGAVGSVQLFLRQPLHEVRRIALDPASRAAATLVRTLLDESVGSQLVADVPVGVFLSGGIDSSTVAAFAARHAEGPLHSFNVAYADAGYDESSIAREMFPIDR